MSLQTKFAICEEDINSALLERKVETRMGLCGLLAKQHVFYFGGPGVAKSMIADTLVRWINGKRFKLQLNMYTTPEETVGHFSVKKMIEEDQYVRHIQDKLPEAHIAFLDEPFNASSGILNSLNEILNEGTFTSCGRRYECPLQCCFAASNLTPHGRDDGEGLLAMFDRFLLRKEVDTLRDETSWEALIASTVDLRGLAYEPRLRCELGLDELERARVEANVLPIGSEVVDMLHAIRRSLAEQGVCLSPRRWVKSIPIIRANAYIAGADKVLPEHLSILETVLWEHPVDHPAIVSATIGRISCPDDYLANELLRQARSIAQKPFGSRQECLSAIDEMDVVISKLSSIKGKVAEEAVAYARSQSEQALARMMRMSASRSI